MPAAAEYGGFTDTSGLVLVQTPNGPAWVPAFVAARLAQVQSPPSPPPPVIKPPVISSSNDIYMMAPRGSPDSDSTPAGIIGRTTLPPDDHPAVQMADMLTAAASAGILGPIAAARLK